MVMEPFEPAPGSRPEQRRPLLMDPAGPRPSGFAPPSAITTAAPAAQPEVVSGSVPTEPASPGPVQQAVSATPSVLAGPLTRTGSSGPGVPGEASFGPVSQIVRISIRTPSSRIDLVLPDRSTIAETLETVLELAPRSLREQAIAHGGWILRTAAGDMLPGSTTLLDHGIADGTTLFLTGIDATDTTPVYDDVADAVADTVLGDPAAWPTGGGRALALGAAGAFAALSCLALLLAGPPWTAVAVSLGGVALIAQVAAGLLSREVGDAGTAVVAGLLSVAAGAAAATVATAGDSPLLDVGAAQLLLGAAAATLLATTATLAIGTRRVPFAAIVTGGLLVCFALACCVFFDLSAAGGAAIVAGLALGLMPVVPTAALRLARFELNPLPATADEVYADHETVDASAVAQRTRQAVGYVTALIQGLTWPTLAACVSLAFSHDVTSQVLAGVVGVGLLLRARLFVTVGQRLPLLIAGLGAVIALLAALMVQFDGASVMLATAVPALLGVVVCLMLAARRKRASPPLVRAAEILELVIAIAVVPLVAGVLGLFGFIRGLGG
jgi:type VII secretion integral membrane protein EccD